MWAQYVWCDNNEWGTILWNQNIFMYIITTINTLHIYSVSFVTLWVQQLPWDVLPHNRNTPYLSVIISTFRTSHREELFSLTQHMEPNLINPPFFKMNFLCLITAHIWIYVPSHLLFSYNKLELCVWQIINSILVQCAIQQLYWLHHFLATQFPIAIHRG